MRGSLQKRVEFLEESGVPPAAVRRALDRFLDHGELPTREAMIKILGRTLVLLAHMATMEPKDSAGGVLTGRIRTWDQLASEIEAGTFDPRKL